eukprot:CAMPEP_0204403550 /NCGR_PEP_ID=MMETSP0470-20130426/5970_1 /ASSEMBLY_ACC=CAM_ASM_000385 /TAXON_ID=2969 /ORGANISM="Oxyrrhis marina" /LENGTH=35 /DNA_ID= /DNA_START= /DNA_END= /DNA_ORIENTATION=
MNQPLTAACSLSFESGSASRQLEPRPPEHASCPRL